MPRVFISVERRRVCDDIAEEILKARRARGESVDRLVGIAANRGWQIPELK
jgi:hypothetical protein